MVREGTPGIYKLRAAEPKCRRPLMEFFATRDEVAARSIDLEHV